jgi:hypothetical protein
MAPGLTGGVPIGLSSPARSMYAMDRPSESGGTNLPAASRNRSLEVVMGRPRRVTCDALVGRLFFGEDPDA